MKPAARARRLRPLKSFFKSEAGAAPVLAKMPGIHKDLRGNTVRVTADPAKVQIFANGRSLYYR